MTTTTAASATQTATKSLLSALGTGSGVDTAALVDGLVEAQYAARTAQLTARADKLTAQISGVSTIKNTISQFATALDTLAKGGTLRTQPKVSAAGVLSASAGSAGIASSLATTVRVDRLASAQVAAVAVTTAGGDPATRTGVLGSGRFTLSLGSADYATATDGTRTMTDFTAARPAKSVSFDLTNATVDTIAAAINAKGATLGITASVVTGANGEPNLSLRGASGAARAFTVAVEGDASLAQFAVGPGSTVTGVAQNAELAVDGVLVQRASNTIDDLVPGVTLELAGTGATTVSATRPTAALTQAVEDLVETYNTVLAVVQEQTDAKTGTLFTDPAAQALLRSLKALTLAPVNSGASGGSPATLAEIGVRTERDGTVSVDPTQLAVTLARYPDAVEAMFRPSNGAAAGLPAKLQAMASAATSTRTGLGASATRYTEAQGDVADARAKVVADSEAMATRLTAQFAAMNTRVSAYKSVQTFLTNQIAAWNRSDD